MTQNAAYWIEKLGLTEHPEGGFFRETYRSADILPESALPQRYDAPRNASTCIYYLLEHLNRSVFHRLKSDEIWHFYAGSSSVRLLMIDPDGNLTESLVGNNPENGEVFHLVIPHGCWFAAELTNKDGFALVGCTVAPGFDFTDFEMGNKAVLCDLFPQYEDIIAQFTH